MAFMPCSMLDHTALGACLLLLATLGRHGGGRGRPLGDGPVQFHWDPPSSHPLKNGWGEGTWIPQNDRLVSF